MEGNREAGDGLGQPEQGAPDERPGGARASVFPVPAWPPSFFALAFAALAAVCGLGYAGALDGAFIYDDLVNITQRASLRWTGLRLENWIAAVAESPSKRPVALATFGLHYYSGFDSARAFRLVNVAIHGVNGALVVLLAHALWQRARELGARGGAAVARIDRAHLPWIALAIGLVFVAHPLQTQSVTYVVQRMNAMSATFHLLALLGYIEARRVESSGVRAAWFFFALVAWALGLGSKETAIVAPAAAWLYEWYFERDLDFGFLRQSAIAGVLVGLPTLIAAFVLLEMSGFRPFAAYPEKDFTALERLATQPRVLAMHVGQWLWPAPSRLSLLHDIEVSRSAFSPATTLPAIGAVLAAIGACAALAVRHRLASFALAWLFLHCAVEFSVLPLSLAMEHRFYLPQFGLVLLASVVVGPVLARRPRLAVGLVAAVVAALTAATAMRNEAWQTTESIWRDVLAKYPAEFSATVNLGTELARQGRYAEALEYGQRAAAMAPDDTEVQTNVGQALAGLGRHEEAVERFELALELDPANPVAPMSLGRSLVFAGRLDEAIEHFAEQAERTGTASAWIQHGDALLLNGAPMRARASYLEAARLAPAAAEPQQQLGVAAAAMGEPERAIQHFERALALSRGPDHELHSHLGLAYAATGDEARAIAEFERVVALAPAWPVGLNNLAWFLATAGDPALRDGPRALQLVERALRAVPEDAGFGSTFAAALAASGQTAAAAEVAGQAAQRAERQGDAQLADELRVRQQEYAAAAADEGARD